MRPPVTLQTTTTLAAVSPALVKAMASKSAVWFCSSVRERGERAIWDAWSTLGLLGTSQATNAAMASAMAEATTCGSRMRARRCDSLNVNGILSLQKEKPPASTLRSTRWRPGGPDDERRVSPVALRHRLSTALL